MTEEDAKAFSVRLMDVFELQARTKKYGKGSENGASENLDVLKKRLEDEKKWSVGSTTMRVNDRKPNVKSWNALFLNTEIMLMIRLMTLRS